MTKVFISYRREHESAVRHLADDIEALGHDVWFDGELSGGQAWWDQILGQIRETDVFVLALAPGVLDSVACQRELAYARALGKPLLPTMVADGVVIGRLPPTLSSLHIVDYRWRDRGGLASLSRALSHISPAGPMPSPLPSPPEAPLAAGPPVDPLNEENPSVTGRTREASTSPSAYALRGGVAVVAAGLEYAASGALAAAVDPLHVTAKPLDSFTAFAALTSYGVALLAGLFWAFTRSPSRSAATVLVVSLTAGAVSLVPKLIAYQPLGPSLRETLGWVALTTLVAAATRRRTRHALAVGAGLGALGGVGWSIASAGLGDSVSVVTAAMLGADGLTLGLVVPFAIRLADRAVAG